MENNKLFFIGQKALIENENGELLFLTTPENGLDFPGGQILIGETDLEESLKREIKEETNLEIEVGNPFTTWSIDFPEQNKSVFFVGYICTYVSGKVILSKEHVNFKWVNKETYREFSEDSIWFKVLEKYFTQL